MTQLEGANTDRRWASREPIVCIGACHLELPKNVSLLVSRVRLDTHFGSADSPVEPAGERANRIAVYGGERLELHRGQLDSLFLEFLEHARRIFEKAAAQVRV